jgi:hypothetical protein
MTIRPSTAAPILAVLAIVLVTLGVLATVIVLREHGEMVRDAYCLGWASAAVARYIDDNDGSYPPDWESLRPSFDKVTDHSFTFEEVQSRTIIDFGIDPTNPPAEFLSLRSGRGVHWDRPDPNEQIRERLVANRP